jgi:hypothetical protein
MSGNFTAGRSLLKDSVGVGHGLALELDRSWTEMVGVNP